MEMACTNIKITPCDDIIANCMSHFYESANYVKTIEFFILFPESLAYNTRGRAALPHTPFIMLISSQMQFINSQIFGSDQ